MLKRIIAAAAGFFCSAAAVAGIWGFAKFDSDPQKQGIILGVIGVAGLCLIAAFIAASGAWFFFGQAFRNRE